jgi:hypothetical protein
VTDSVPPLDNISDVVFGSHIICRRFGYIFISQRVVQVERSVWFYFKECSFH